MSQEPKKRHSRQRQGKRRAHIHLATTAGVTCANCGAPVLPHQVCKKCGYYKGQEIFNVTKVTHRTLTKNEK